MKYLSLFLFAAVFIFLSASVNWAPSAAEDTPSARDLARNAAFDQLIDAANRKGPIRVIVRLNVDFRPEGRLGDAGRSVQRIGIKDAQNALLRSMPAERKSQAKLFDYIPFIALETTADDLAKLRDDASVFGIEEDIVGEAALVESTGIVGAPAAWTSGYTGAGQAVAIVDSGVDRSHAFLAGKVVSEACYSSNVSGQSTSVCPGGASSSTALNSGVHCPSNVNGCAHGTNVAGIAAGTNASMSGVAKGADIIAIQIFSSFESTTTCGGTAPCGRYWTSDLIRGLERVKTLSDTMDNIAAVNMSLQTGQQFASNCDATHAATKAAIDNLRSVGIPSTICSGNYAFTNALTAPACISTSISVGSVDDGSLGTVTNAVSSFSDSSPLLHLLAPGRWINSSIPGNLYSNYSGTSMAAPHVAGAFAVMRQRNPHATIERMMKALTLTGQPITDTRNNIVKPRIRVDLAVNALTRDNFFDFDGDGRADLSTRRPSDNTWYLLRAVAGFTAQQFGEAGDRMVPADYDGDGKADVAMFRGSNGTWYIYMSQSQTYQAFGWGQNGDLPVPTDRDADGKTDLVIFRPSNNTWYTRFANATFNTFQFGEAGDKPMLGDFDADGIGDVALFRPSNNNWYIIKSGSGFFIQTWGEAGDIPTTGDFDGDGRTDQAVFRPTTGQWFLSQTTAGFSSRNWGQAGDVPAAADFDGDGKTDIALFRPSNGTWYIVQSRDGILIQQFGQTGDMPTQSSFVY